MIRRALAAALYLGAALGTAACGGVLSDQIAVLAVGRPTFAIEVHRASPDTSVAFDSTQGPPLVPDTSGNTWVVTKIAPPLAGARLWQMLLN